MFAWISNNIVTIISVCVVLALIGLAVFSLVRDKKKGSGGCTGNCATCRMGCSYNQVKK
ncbi:MAG TPA: FeoB-associated Cys-rich membrane protein [Ruminococcaceae bacterium]|nr:FeoB-associated Cys-rich membrane protein [Oscillospiraceae bacterium]